MTDLTLCFYRTGPNDPLINKITSLITGEFCHCELAFTNAIKEKSVLACGIWQNETVFLEKKRFLASEWKFLNLRVTPSQKQKVMQYVENLYRNEIPFNTSGLWRCIFYPRKSDEKQVFCSEMLVLALQKIGFLQNLTASATTPTKLYKEAKKICALSASPVDIDYRIQTVENIAPLNVGKNLMYPTNSKKFCKTKNNLNISDFIPVYAKTKCNNTKTFYKTKRSFK